MTVRDQVEKAVRQFFFTKMDAQTDKLRSAALWDLHFGPYDAEYYKDAHELESWPGYSSAVEKLEEWSSENLMKVWVDTQTMEVLETEPDEEFLDDIYVFDRGDVARLVFKQLITDGGMLA